MASDISSAADLHLRIERLAYAYWEERGRPFGTPEVDWFRAEAEIRHEPTPLETVARAIGSALGSILGSAAHVNLA